MKPLLVAASTALTWTRRTWQPIAVIAGAVLAIIGATGTVWSLCAWLAPQLGPWPAATVGGTLTCAAAFRWGRLTLVD